MVIQRIKIEHFAGIVREEIVFSPQITVLEWRKSNAVFKAIGVILKNREILRRIKDVFDDTRIEADVALTNATYRITAVGQEKEKSFRYTAVDESGAPCDNFFRLIEKSREEEVLSWFYINKAEEYARKLQFYKEEMIYASKLKLSQKTGGIAGTRTFYLCLNRYLKNYPPTPIPGKTDFVVQAQEDGAFVAVDKRTGEEPIFSDAERIMFAFICFLSVNAFWEEVEAIRDPEHEKMPIFVPELTSRLDATKDVKPLIKSAQAQGRQIITEMPV